MTKIELGTMMKRLRDEALAAAPADCLEPMEGVVTQIDGFRCTARFGELEMGVDEPVIFGGTGTAPNPAEVALAGLGASIQVTLLCYAGYLDIDVGDLQVKLSGALDARGFRYRSHRSGRLLRYRCPRLLHRQSFCRRACATVRMCRKMLSGAGRLPRADDGEPLLRPARKLRRRLERMPVVRILLLLTSLLFAVPVSASEAPIASPRLAALQAQLDGRNDGGDVAAFWADVRAKGTPLIEPVAGEPAQMTLTFLWREPTDRDHIDLGVFGVFNATPWQTGDPLIRLAHTDIWYRSYRVSAALRAQYMLIGRDGAARGAKPQRAWSHTDEAGRDRDFDLFLDPLNPRTIDDVYFLPHSRESIFDGPDAPRETWLAPKPARLHGRMIDLTIRSAVLGNERNLAVYVPDPSLTKGKPPGLLLLFDGPSYRAAGRVPEMLDRMIAAGAIAPTVAVMVDSITLDNREKELAPNEPFTRFIAEELMPMLRTRFGLSGDPRKTVIAGASRGGQSASFIAMRHPELFGNVIAQSPALWWGPSEADMDTHWLARAFENRDRLPIRFYIQMGTLEDAKSMLGTARHFQEILHSKGYDVTYREFVGGHTFFSWRAILPPGADRVTACRRTPG